LQLGGKKMQGLTFSTQAFIDGGFRAAISGKTFDMATIQAKLSEGMSPTEIARDMGISRGTVYKAKAWMPSSSEVIGHTKS